MGKVMDELNQWSTGHLCPNPICYIVNGILQYLAVMQNDIGQCKSDFGNAFSNFTTAYRLLVNNSAGVGPANGDEIQLRHNEARIKEGLLDFSNGLRDIATGVADCHLSDLAQIMDQLAGKLAIPPVIRVAETFIQILVDGHEIELEV